MRFHETARPVASTDRRAQGRLCRPVNPHQRNPLFPTRSLRPPHPTNQAGDGASTHLVAAEGCGRGASSAINLGWRTRNLVTG